MDRYLIEAPHEDHNCLALLDLLSAMGFLNNFDWGCKDGIHTGWAIIEAENRAQASMAVPPLIRARARVVKLNKFEDEEVLKLHGK